MDRGTSRFAGGTRQGCSVSLGSRAVSPAYWYRCAVLLVAPRLRRGPFGLDAFDLERVCGRTNSAFSGRKPRRALWMDTVSTSRVVNARRKAWFNRPMLRTSVVRARIRGAGPGQAALRPSFPLE